MIVKQLSKLPEPDKNMDELCARYYYQFGEILLNMGTLTDSDILTLEIMSERMAAYKRATQAGEKVTFQFNQILLMLTEFNLTPKSRVKTKLKVNNDALQNVIDM